MGWNGKCDCGCLRVVDTYGDYAAYCKKYREFCYAAEPVDSLLKEWMIVHPERCEKKYVLDVECNDDPKQTIGKRS